MKTDLDSLMKKNKIDAILVTGPGQHNPAMVYFTGIAHLTIADLIKKRGQPPLLFHAPMERDEATRTGLLTRSYNDYPVMKYLKETKNNREKASAMRYQKMLLDAEVKSGNVALYGAKDLGSGYAVFTALKQLMPEVTFTGYVQDEILLQAMMTKDDNEIEHIRKMAKITVDVVSEVANYLTTRKVKKGVLLKKNGNPVTIADVKRKIDLWLAERGAENPESTIFAIGRDAGVPHSSGTPTDTLKLGQTIVFDIFPCEAGGGYFYDFTRTWCLGFSPDDVQKLYEDVLSTYRTIVKELEINRRFSDYQKRTCQIFEEQGHPTIESDPNTETGFVHSLGHGLGLHVHEKPWSGATASNTDILSPGSVFTIEPGLYYPDKQMGVRLEDTYFAHQDGKFEKFADFPMDLVLPVKK